MLKKESFKISILLALLLLPAKTLAAQESSDDSAGNPPKSYNMALDQALNSIEKARGQIQDDILPGLSSSGTAAVRPASPAAEQTNEERNIDSLEANDAELSDVLRTISDKTKVVFEVQDNVQGKVTISLKNVKLKDALRIILSANNWAYSEENGKLVIMTGEDYVKKFGYPFEYNVKTKVIPLVGKSSEKIKKALEGIKGSLGRVIFDASTNSFILIDSAEKVDEMAKLIKELDTEADSQEFKIEYADLNYVANELRKIVPEGTGALVIDKDNKTIKATDTKENLRKMEAFVKMLDQPNEAMEVKVKVAQIILAEEYAMGIDWDAIVSDYQTVNFGGFAGGLPSDEEEKNLSLGTLSNEDYAVLLDALDTVGTVRNIEDDKKEVKINQPGEVVIRLSQLSMGKEDLSAEDQEGGKEVKYLLTPRVEPSGVVFNIKPELDLVKGDTLVKRANDESAADIIVPEDSTIIIGGLFKTVMTQTINKIPLLGSLPILGLAFRSQSKMLQKTEVVVFLTPQIKSGNSEE